jgi:DNA-binding IclR family transcriptional regulator
MKASRKTYHVPAAARALSLLEALGGAREGRTLSALADTLKIPRPSCLRLLSTLETMDYVRQNAETGLYRLTGKVAHLAAQRMKSYDLRNVARPVLVDLHHSTGETAELVIRDGDAALLLDRVEATEGLRIHMVIGSRIPLPLQHTGRAMLAAMDEAERERILKASDEFFRKAPREVTPNRIRKELEEAREKGFAWGSGMRRPEVTRVATAVRDVAGQPVVAIGIAGPTFRVAERVDPLSKTLLKAAQRLAAEGIVVP